MAARTGGDGRAMLPEFENHAVYIYAAYGLAAATLGALIAAIVYRARRARAKVERLQRQADESDPPAQG